MQSERWQRIKLLFTEIVELPEPLQAGRLAEIDDDLRDEIANLLDAHFSPHGFIDDPILVGLDPAAADDALPGTKIGGFEIIEKIGEGGMGVVYLAEHQGDGFTQKVALKLIKRGMDSSSVHKRFVTERSLLARLEHPNIARLIDGGSTSDGMPFFVMEYIQGENIRDFCRSRRLDTQARLRLFMKVARAVSYAHQNLIVHRDIKPSNIIVTDDGEPKLLDFGIAKLISPELGDDRESTQTFSRPLTPEYASPEQIRGGITTTSTDIYSLGIVLYELLTGRRPFEVGNKSIFEISNAVLTEEPLKPSVAVYSVSRAPEAGKTDTNKPATNENTGTNRPGIYRDRTSLRGDLDNILLKAIQKKPEDRYGSLSEFCDDIERFLTGLPVRATAPSALYRFRKFITRHRTASAFAALVLLLSVFAAWQAVSATLARREAEHRFSEIRQLARFVIFDYQDGIRNLSGATAIREKMVDDGAAFLDRLVADNPRDPELRLELARAYDRLGDVKGNFFTPSLANATRAHEFYEKALALKSRLVEDSPSNTAFREELAQTYDKLADLEFGNANQKESVAFYRRAIEIREALGAATSNDPDLRLRLARGYRNIGVRGRTTENTEESIEHCRRAISMIEEFVAARPEDQSVAEAIADFHEGIPIILESNPARRAESVAEYRRVIEMRRQLSDRFPTNPVISQKLGMIYSYLGDTFYELELKRESIAEYRTAVSILEPLTIRDPENGQLQQDFAAVTGSLAFTLAELGDGGESVAIFEKVLKTLETKLAKDPQDKTTHFRYGMALEGAARARLNRAREKSRSVSERAAALDDVIEKLTQITH